MLPAWLDVIEPRARHRQFADYNFGTTGLLGPLIVLPYPDRYRFSSMPGGIVPDYYQDTLALLGHPLTDPVQELDGDISKRAVLDKTEHHLAGIEPKEAVARDGVRVRIILLGH